MMEEQRRKRAEGEGALSVEVCSIEIHPCHRQFIRASGLFSAVEWDAAGGRSGSGGETRRHLHGAIVNG